MPGESSVLGKQGLFALFEQLLAFLFLKNADGSKIEAKNNCLYGFGHLLAWLYSLEHRCPECRHVHNLHERVNSVDVYVLERAQDGHRRVPVAQLPVEAVTWRACPEKEIGLVLLLIIAVGDDNVIRVVKLDELLAIIQAGPAKRTYIVMYVCPQTATAFLLVQGKKSA